MKTIFVKFIFLSSIIILQSCNDSFSPVGDFEEGYSLYCILNNSEDVQKIYLFKNFLPENLDPGSYNQNRTVGNAKIRISDGERNFIFTDTTEYIDSLGYEISYYQIRNFNPVNTNLRLTAIVPGDKLLTGIADVSTKEFDFFFRTKRDIERIPLTKYSVRFSDEIPFEFLPVFSINYKIIEGGDTISHRKEVPHYYYSDNGKFFPKYPDIETRTYIDYDISVLEDTFREIAAENISKKIQIINATVNITQVSYPLNIFYKASKTARDGFSIKLQEPNISNIIDGNGIFGSKKTKSLNVNFAKSWGGLFGELGLSF